MELAIGTSIAFVILVSAFVWWRYTSVERGARKRDARILPLIDPVAEKLADGREPTRQEIADIAAKPFARPFLYQMLKHFERLDLFPADLNTEEKQAEAELAYWMMHPNEFLEPPEKIELVEKVRRKTDGEACDFYVFRFQMPEGHWAAGEGWLLGLAGPYVSSAMPYSGFTGAFSRCGDKFGVVEPSELVDWYIRMVTRKASR